jgi:hypothetical protein
LTAFDAAVFTVFSTEDLQYCTKYSMRKGTLELLKLVDWIVLVKSMIDMTPIVFILNMERFLASLQ